MPNSLATTKKLAESAGVTGLLECPCQPALVSYPWNGVVDQLQIKVSIMLFELTVVHVI
jgi:hypothetical protein